MGMGLDIEGSYRTGWMVVIASVVLTLTLWAYALGGGA
jgi:succinate dehydrogenase/fumarate reductase cytochrome b subunit